MRTGSMSITLTLLMAGALLVGACQSRGGSAPPPPSTAPGPAPGAAQGPGLQRNTLHTLVLPTLRQEDLSHADPANFAAALGKDPDRIFAFIRDSIAFEAYRGLLRGPRGTLLAAAGNSVDRAALLAAMLEKAGQRVRFARGTLDERHARDLVMSMWAQREELPAGPLPDVPADIKQRVSADFQDSRRNKGEPNKKCHDTVSFVQSVIRPKCNNASLASRALFEISQ